MIVRYISPAAGCMLLFFVFCALPGCTGRNPWMFTEPPTRVEPSPIVRAERKTVVVVGEFRDPTAVPPYARGVGKFMAESLSRALLNDGKYDVWINPQLSREVEHAVLLSPSEFAANLARIRLGNEKVHFVILGKVTDFQHTGDLPRQASRWGLLGPRNEAIVAIDVKIVDLRMRRVVGAEHIRATVPAGRTNTKELYGALPFDSYLFWSTPLGRASKQAIETAVARTDRVVPPPLVDPLIEQMLTWRQVRIAGGAFAGLETGQELYVLRKQQQRPPGRESELRWKPVLDSHTGTPLKVRIDSVSRTHSTGWLMGERPLEVSLRGALLASELPPPEDAPTPLSERAPQRFSDQAVDAKPGPLANVPPEPGEGG